MNLELVALGIALVIALLVMLIPRFYENLYVPLPKQDSDAISSFISEEAPWKHIGDSTIEPISVGPSNLSTQPGEPIFKTLRVEANKVDEAKWRFKLRFLFFNTIKETIVIDDIHTRVYEKQVPTPNYATVTYRGEILLLQDNTILKDDQPYSLDGGDGCEITLVLEMTRLEGAPIYGGNQAKVGPVRTVFGLLIDYYIVGLSSIARKAKPSDCLYLFEYKSNDDYSEFKAVDAKAIEEFKQRHRNSSPMMEVILKLEHLLEEHLAFRPIPKA